MQEETKVSWKMNCSPLGSHNVKFCFFKGESIVSDSGMVGSYEAG